ncbi:transmembrane amino acid transporter protein-domain-containing protein [Aspergillus pseudonomiae]|uniref:Transmembrane amino acid transporter protein-domain-containing protein n=1 Tax=Aspergillus pseudonomiae TaxID=1506151 RepID=A0A5N6HK71_9EURO|nr:transmembrane amino acid transporter protein-domain-containing protein [Aspergillus pseudonomiae]KAB8254628.1 transmembrane amino acid transporter protein-domain-containing protein [Aspergillus pseudonomiae]KAE8399812.1 transmembrane amino acid transporter protein-domain-containing protein [Aspergillus pseudonomiae]
MPSPITPFEDEDIGGSSTLERTTLGVRIPSSNPPDLPPELDVFSRGNSSGPTGYLIDAYSVNRPRAASFSARFRHAGGVNSIDSFARSWQRAAGFPEIIPRRPSFVTVESDEEWAVHDTATSQDRRPLLAADGEEDGHGLDDQGTPKGIASIFGSSLDRSAGTSYGTISSRVSEATRRHAVQLHREQEARLDAPASEDTESLLVKQVHHEDGTRESIVVGQSTVPQTIFNSVNVLIGVGLLSLPLAMKQAGWLLGLTFLSFAAAVTSYTAKILARCLDVDRSLVTYADLAYISFGNHARLATSLLFCLELIGACVALVVLFADSLQALIPGLSSLQWKLICGLMLVPLNFVPLRLLSVTSILGIISCTSIVMLICLDGLLKPNGPGSLYEPARTSLFPNNWRTVPLSFGLIMSPWGGHGVFPNIYRDMRHPGKYGKSLWATYLFTYSLDCAMAIVGWVMFGDEVRDEVTANILLTNEYPRGISICIIIFIAIIPITKVPLNCRPLVATVEVLCGLGPHVALVSENPNSIRVAIRQSLQAIIRLLVIAVIVLMAILCPSFDRIMALMGSALCFTICIVLPLAFYLKIFGQEISRREWILDWFLLLISTALAIVGTAWAFLPENMISVQ